MCGKKVPVGPELPLVVYGVEPPQGAPFLVAGAARGYEYFDCVTQVRDLTVPDGKVLTYQFNDYGNVVAVHDELGFAAFAKFAGTGKPNTLESVSKLHRLVADLLAAAMVRYNGIDCAYLHNLQGDTVGSVDMDGTLVVQCGYDAWGKPSTQIRRAK